MVKVLSQSGMSLADAYDVEGSIAGIEQLLPAEVQVVHDLSQTLTMERMQAIITAVGTAATSQSTAFSVSLNPLTESVARIYGVTVVVSVTSRMANINLSIRDPNTGRELPIWVWDGTNEDTIRFDDGTGLANQITLRPSAFYNPLPLCLYGIDLPQHVNQFRLRGTTSAFGAGTVVARAVIYAAFIDAAGALSSRGVPIPSW